MAGWAASRLSLCQARPRGGAACALFGMMDANGDGFLRLDDFEIIASRSREAQRYRRPQTIRRFST